LIYLALFGRGLNPRTRVIGDAGQRRIDGFGQNGVQEHRLPEESSLRRRQFGALATFEARAVDTVSVAAAVSPKMKAINVLPRIDHGHRRPGLEAAVGIREPSRVVNEARLRRRFRVGLAGESLADSLGSPIGRMARE
jgi:hypothetical protein